MSSRDHQNLFLQQQQLKNHEGSITQDGTIAKLNGDEDAEQEPFERRIIGGATLSKVEQKKEEEEFLPSLRMTQQSSAIYGHAGHGAQTRASLEKPINM